MEGFELVDGKFIACVVDEAALERTYVLGAIFDNGESAWRLLRAAHPHVFQSSSYNTRGMYVGFLRKVAVYFRAKGIVAMPTSAADWQSAIVGIYEYHLKDQPGKSTLRTRITQWQEGIKPMLEFLRDIAKIIPKTIRIPPKRNFRAKRQPNFNKGTIVDGTFQKIGTPQDIHETSALLLNLDISQTSAEYLESFRDRLITVRSALDADCVAYLQSMAAHFEYGERLLKMCTEAQANALKAKYQAVKDTAYREMRRHLEQDNLPGATEISLARILRLFLMEDRQGGVKQIFKSTWLPDWQCINFPSEIPMPPFPEFTGIARRFRWMLGFIDVTDICILHMLLSLRNPSFNAVALFDAKLKDKRGNLNFTFVVDGKAFVVDKRRARAKKRSTLDGESILAVNTMLRMTKRAREHLPDSSPLKNRLFLVDKYDGVCAMKYGTLYNFADSGARSLRWLLPRTFATGVPAAHVIPKRIRRTNAVLEWFRTGSVLKAARLIGNSTKVVIKHYIPEALLQAWNVRLVRRYQNLLLATASAQEPYCLAATDFSTLGELKKFIDEMLKEHSSTSSKLAAIIHERFCHPEQFDADNKQASATKPGSLVVNISPENLSVLYAFRDVAYEKGFQSLQSPTSKRGRISAEAVVDLADLLTTRLPDHHDTTIRSAHIEAERLAAALVGEIRSGAFATFEKQE